MEFGDILRDEKFGGILMTKRRTLTYSRIMTYTVIFFTVWSVRELIIRPIFLNQLDGVMFEIVESLMKLLIWTLPAIWLIKQFQEEMWLSLKEMFTNKPP